LHFFPGHRPDRKIVQPGTILLVPIKTGAAKKRAFDERRSQVVQM
jgi:hypothetical protein